MEQATWKRAAEVKARSPRRPVLRGEPEPGNAWTDYEGFDGILNQNPVACQALGEFLNGHGELDREGAAALLERFTPFLLRLQRGTHRSEVSRIVPWSEWISISTNGWRQTILGICRARFLAEEGHPGEAVTLLLDLLQFQSDEGRVGGWYGGMVAIGNQQRILTELHGMMSLGLTDRAMEDQIARELGILEATLPDFGECMRDMAMTRGFQVLKAGTVQKFLDDFQGQGRKLSTWKFGFSEKLMLSKFVDLEARMAERIAAGNARPWPEARRATAAACAELAAARNPLHGWDGNPRNVPDWLPSQRACLESVVRFRIVRMAAHYRAHGTLLDLADPFGDRLRSRKSGPVLKIWSVGGDGVDDGGFGDWATKGSRDIVLEVRR